MTDMEKFQLAYISNFLSNNFGIDHIGDFFRIVVDIGVVSLVVYRLVLLVRETRAWQLIKGILFILIAAKIGGYFGLQTLSYLLNHAVQYIAIALVVIFQPELRRALEQIGRSKFRSLFIMDETEIEQKGSNIIEQVSLAVEHFTKTKTGALIVFEKQTKLGEVIHSGVLLDAQISSQLLMSVFSTTTPLHDGAVVIRANKLKAAGCFLPLTDNPHVSKELGTRHRAAIGVTEAADCMALVVSEESGKISIARGGKIERGLNLERMKEILAEHLAEKVTESRRLHIWKVKSK